MKSSPVLAARGFTIALVVLCLSGLMGASPAQAQDQGAIEKITELNKKALDAYQDADFPKARTFLKQALDLCSSAGLDRHAIAARTHIHMGVVLAGGFNQKDLAIKQFRTALDIEPTIQVTKNVDTPEVEAVFKEAQEGGGGESAPPAGGGSDAPEKTSAPPAAAAPSNGLIHLPVKKASPGAPIMIAARVSNSDVAKVVLSYKGGDDDDYTTKDLTKAGSRFSGQIPASATSGGKISYYLEAQDSEGTVLASAGGESRPLVISLGGKDCGDDEDCDEGGPAGPPIFIGILGGIGVGYTTGHADLTNANKVINGFAPSSAFHIAPEFGYFVSADWRLSLQARIQIVSGPTPLVDSNGTHQPAKMGVAALARSSWFFGSGGMRPYVTAALGGGQIRHVVVFDKAARMCGSNGDQKCVDTVTAGPLFVGGGGGLSIAFTDNVGLIVELNALLGAPKFTAHFDFNGGLSLRF